MELAKHKNLPDNSTNSSISDPSPPTDDDLLSIETFY